jgi:hypothetical protein
MACHASYDNRRRAARAETIATTVMMTKAAMPSSTGHEPARLTICTGIALPSSWAKPVTMNDTCSSSVQNSV